MVASGAISAKRESSNRTAVSVASIYPSPSRQRRAAATYCNVASRRIFPCSRRTTSCASDARLASSAVEAGRGRLSRLAGKLDSLSPLAVLSRGYALVWNEEGRLVRQPAEVRVGEALRIRVSGGALGAVVTSREGA